jgi:hypothetical protein
VCPAGAVESKPQAIELKFNVEDGLTPPPSMILKACTSLSRTKLQDHGSTGGGATAIP